MHSDQDPNKDGGPNKSRAKKKKDNKSTADDEDEWAALMAQAPVKEEKKAEPSAEAATVSSSKKKRNKKKKTEEAADNTAEIDNSNEPNNDDQPQNSEHPATTSANKKKKKQPNEAKTAPPKKKNAALLARMKETLERQRVEEERKKEEDEAIRKALEEAEALDAAREREEQELREKRKQAKKERLQRMKEEGKPVTKSQKESHARLGMMMEALRIQGVEIPHKNSESNEKKPVVYAKKKKKPVKTTDKINGKSPMVTMQIDVSTVNGAVTETNELLKVEQLQSGNTSESVPDDWEAAVDAEMKSDAGNSLIHTNGTVQTKTALISNDDGDKSQSGAKKKKLRSPVVCVLGHVDTGKTKILDKLRLTNVQAGEAGGITQQIGVTNVGKQNLTDNLKKLSYMNNFRFIIPGFLIIDTPGHESFRNLRSRGSSLCDIAILVVDIMHGIEQQTLESFKLLMDKKAPFIIALNKVDRLYNWKSYNDISVGDALLKQDSNTAGEFRERFNQVLAQFAEQGVNIGLFNEVDDFRSIIPVVPTSAHSGDGICDLIATVCKYAQSYLLKRLTRNDSVRQLVVMEVKSVVGLGMVVDAILINGLLTEGDTIVLSGTQGPIVTQIKAILTSQPMTDLRASKGNFTKHYSVNESQGIRLSASGELENVIAGTPIHVVSEEKPLELCIQDAAHYVEHALNAFHTEEVGVYVQASTLGSLEALMEFLEASKISVAGVNIGPVHKKDVLKASVMHQKEPMYAVILAFDVKVESEAILYAKKENVKIFTADIIYHLFDAFTQYTQDCKRALKEQHRNEAVFPCKLSIMPQFIFNERDPIIVGVSVDAGTLHVGTPLCVPSRDFVSIGTVATIEINKKPINKATVGQQVAIKINPVSGETPKMYGRHFDSTDVLVSKITRDSIDIQKEYFRDEMTKSDWQLIVELKKSFSIL